MRLRRKPWVDEAIHEFDDFVVSRDQEIGEEKKGKVIDVVQTGYRLGERVLRFAKVVGRFHQPAG